MTSCLEDRDTETLHNSAYEAFEQGQLRQASALFAALLQRDWTTRSEGRQVDAVEAQEVIASEPEDGNVWWRDPDEAEADS